MQQLALAELQAIKAMARSGNAQAERIAFLGANKAYNETIEPCTLELSDTAFMEESNRARKAAAAGASGF